MQIVLVSTRTVLRLPQQHMYYMLFCLFLQIVVRVGLLYLYALFNFPLNENLRGDYITCMNAANSQEDKREARFKDFLNSCLQERLVQLDELVEKLPSLI